MTDGMTIEEWFRRMRMPVDSFFVESRILFPEKNFVSEYEPFLDIDELEQVGNAELADNYRKANCEFRDLAPYAESAPEALAFLRAQPLSGDVMVPRPEESAWMSPKERDLVEWFDRGEYAAFLRLSAFFDTKESWIVRYCVCICVFYRKGYVPFCGGRIPDPLLQDIFDPELIAKIKAAAEEGNARALNCLGLLYKTGWRNYRVSIGRDLEAARELFRRSAEAGCTQGKANYANAIESGSGGPEDLDGTERIFRELSAQGLGKADYSLARLAYARSLDGAFDSAAFAEAMLRAAKRGTREAREIVAAAKGDLSPERLVVEYLFYTSRLAGEMRKGDTSKGRKAFGDDEPSFSVYLKDEFRKSLEGGDSQAAKDRKWIADGQPSGAVVPPAGGRETVRMPNLSSANPSFAARLIILVRDRFGGDAPKVYGAAHLSRKTYSSIIGNELRPVSKHTAMAFALGLRLNYSEAVELLKSAGFAFSEFILEDIIVESCIKAGIHDVNRINEILAAHGAKTFPAAEE